jgi:hypothetical protein
MQFTQTQHIIGIPIGFLEALNKWRESIVFLAQELVTIQRHSPLISISSISIGDALKLGFHGVRKVFVLGEMSPYNV